ncbi:hypothetical protein FHQ18_00640 [Deferribacter autotrophicus]|uniref:Uncharacterized protein n=1 Tax=Deferribacter autotrophicus TaxID=500465 RepID=A0A5A8F7L4_9BACT|nr:hypothetical protein [Deferribacter autotrophicus]KAA0259419.1 hypothetical protein FHQ18_00640 [Deferribacter autotrophicus]
MILIFSNYKENDLLKRLKMNIVSIKIAFVAETLPLISNLNLIENITLPIQYHGIKYDMRQLNDDLRNYNLYDKMYYRKDGLNEIEIFFTKYLMCKYFGAKVIFFINQFHYFVNCRELFYDFFNKQYEKNFVIIEKEIYKNILTKNLKNYDEWNLEEWLKKGLRI